VLAPLAERWPTLRAAYPGLSWTAPERWHVTLAFLGELKAGQLHRLRPGLAEVSVTTPPFELVVTGAGVFPNERRPRVLWIGLDGEVSVLTELAAGVRRMARHARIELDRKPFRPHVTVARVRRELPEHDVPHLLRKLTAAEGRRWQVDRLVLMQSTLGPHPHYDEIAAWPLTGLI
jgi:RNA 2',3'-cyclic 3'-phosphodiesterase